MKSPTKVFEFIQKRSWVKSIVDERATGEGDSIIVNLKDGWVYTQNNESVNKFLSVRESGMGTSRNTVYNVALGPKAPKVPKEPKAPKAARVKKAITEVVQETTVVEDTQVTAVPTVQTQKPERALSMSKDAIRKREKRAAQKAVVSE